MTISQYIAHEHRYALKDLYERGLNFTEIGDELGCGSTSISKAIKNLIGEGFLQRRERRRRQIKSGKVNPYKPTEQELIKMVKACRNIGMTYSEISKENNIHYSRVKRYAES